MTDAPERIWAQDADPEHCDYEGGGWWDAECGSVQYTHMVEYIRADIAEAEKRAFRDAAEDALVALQEARSEMRDYADSHPSMKIIFGAEDGLRAVLEAAE
jgi:predicted GNAT superfamily acetyltransferase